MDFEADTTFVKITRNLLHDPIIKSPKLLQLYLYFILVANHQDNFIIQNGKRILIQRGSTKTGIHLLANKLDVPESTLYKRIKELENLGYIVKNSYNKYSIITVVDYDKITCQDSFLGTQRKNKVNPNESLENTNNNDNNEKNVKKKN